MTRKPAGQNWYDVSVDAPDYHISFTITRGHIARILIYTYNIEAFQRLEKQKDNIESLCGFQFDWYSSQSTSVQKRIMYSHDIDYYSAEKQNECFRWFVNCFVKLKETLKTYDA